MTDVVLQDLEKVYPEKRGPGVTAVSRINLTIEPGEFMVLVGPSGCGKSTTLRMIAGLEAISAGTVSIGGRVVNDVLPKDRDIAMVFQNYALYPHMTVYENMAFGLTLRKLPKAEIDTRVREAATMLELTALLDRLPKALSGGQRQRVAVGRAIVRKPKVFLFDEPLSNLDAKMRGSTRTELSKLHARLGATMIYVTHDQVEAMTMGDRICVMRGGHIMQVATPLELYNSPANLFVAGFIGSPPMNLFTGTIRREGATLTFVEKNPVRAPLTLPLPPALAARAAGYVDKLIILGIRPEDVRDAAVAVDATGTFPTAESIVEIAEPMGAETLLHLHTGTAGFIARVRPTDQFRPDDKVRLSFDLQRAHVFDPTTEAVIR